MCSRKGWGNVTGSKESPAIMMNELRHHSPKSFCT